MDDIPLTSLECRLVAERLLKMAEHHEQEQPELAVAMAAVYAQLAQAAATSEAADRAEAWRAERTVNDGLDRLFRRLGPPTGHDTEK